MKKQRSNGRRANGEARTHELLERMVTETSSLRRDMVKEFVGLRGEMTAMRIELKAEIAATNARLDVMIVRLDATNARLDHIVDIPGPRIKNLEDRVAVLEAGRAG